MRGGGGKDRCTATRCGRWAELFGGGVRADTTWRDDSRGRRCRAWSSDRKPSGNPSPGGRGYAVRQDTRRAPSGDPSRMRVRRPANPKDAMPLPSCNLSRRVDTSSGHPRKASFLRHRPRGCRASSDRNHLKHSSAQSRGMSYGPPSLCIWQGSTTRSRSCGLLANFPSSTTRCSTRRSTRA